jgi:hypothetical protein
MSELIDKIMDCRYDDGELSPEIQIDIDQQLSKYLFEPEKLKIIQTREKLDQALIDAESDKPCIARLQKECTDSMHDLRPILFPPALWPFVKQNFLNQSKD